MSVIFYFSVLFATSNLNLLNISVAMFLSSLFYLICVIYKLIKLNYFNNEEYMFCIKF